MENMNITQNPLKFLQQIMYLYLNWKHLELTAKV